MSQPKRKLGRPRNAALDAPFDQDAIAQAVVEDHPEGAPLEHIAALYQVSKELVSQAELKALAKLRACDELAGWRPVTARKTTVAEHA